MFARLLHRLTFALERFILRGAFHQLLFIAALIILVALISGTVVFLTVPQFASFGESVWWGFLRLTDPGYLGDDVDAVSRAVSTVVTVLGYVLFMGALIAIMTQGLGRLLRRLESGVTPITATGHILILGWTNRTATIIEELLLSRGRVQRFLRRVRADRLKIVVMAEEVTTQLANELRSRLGRLWDPDTIILRSGNPLRVEHLARTDFLNAAAIIVPAGEYAPDGTEALDARTIKTLLSISNAAERQGMQAPPALTTELFDPRKITVARAGYTGDIEVIPGSTVISRLIAQNVRHSGLSHVYLELLTHSEGNSIYTRALPELAGRSLRGLETQFATAIPLGVLRSKGGEVVPRLNPATDVTIMEKDRIVFIARSYDAIVPADDEATSEIVAAAGEPIRDEHIDRRVLILGWSHKVPVLLSEFQSYPDERYAVTVVSLVPAEERSAFIARFAGELSRLKIEQIEGDYTAPNDLTALRPDAYDNIVFLASESRATGEESDARTILGYLLLRTLVPRDAGRPRILIELMDPENHNLFANRAGETLISPTILSHMLAHVTLRPDLRLVFEEMFTAGGAEIYFRTSQRYLAGAGPHCFRNIQRAVSAKGEIALGIYQPEGIGRLHLNPPRDSEWSFSNGEELVVLTTNA